MANAVGMKDIETRCAAIANFFYVDSPHELTEEKANIPAGLPYDEHSKTWFDRSAPDRGIRQSMATIIRFARRHVNGGTVDVVLGHSQGGVMVSTLVRKLNEVNHPQFALKGAVTIHSPLKRPHNDTGEPWAPHLRSFHFIAENDEMIPLQASMALAERFANPEISRHSGTHNLQEPLPRANVDQFVAFLSSLLP